MTINDRIVLRRATAARWTFVNPTLLEGEEGLELDTGLRKLGDGSTPWIALPYDTLGITLTALGGLAPLLVTATKTASYTATANQFVPFDLTSGSKVLTLPTAPADGTRVGARIDTQPGTNTVTFTPGGTDTVGLATLSLAAESAVLTYRASYGDWAVTEHGYSKSSFVVPSRQVIAGTGLTGGGNLTADRTLAVAYGTTSTTAAAGNDSRIVGASQGTGNVPASVAIAETIPRYLALNAAIPSSGVLNAAAIRLVAGQVIHSISFATSSTAVSSPTHQWFALLDSTGAVLAVTSDDTTTAWAANTVKTLSLTSAYTVPSSGTYYLAIVITASTTGSYLTPGTPGSAVNALTPVLAYSAGSGLTTPSTVGTVFSPSGAPASGYRYGYVS